MLFPLVVFSQLEKFPVFEGCKGLKIEDTKPCFYKEAKRIFLTEFKVPSIIKKENYKGVANVIFITTAKGEFKLIYVDSAYEELNTEVNRTFKTFPTITPATFNGHAVEMRFMLPIHLPDPKKPSISIEEDLQQTKKENVVDSLKKTTKQSALLFHPAFNECLNASAKKSKNCFYQAVNNAFFKKFKTPSSLLKNKFKGLVTTVFIVTKNGEFKVISINAKDKELKAEIERVFVALPIIKPATKKGIPLEKRFEFPIRFPITYKN